MSGLSDAVAVNEGRKRMNHGHLIDSGDHSSTNNNSEDYEQGNNDHSEDDDESATTYTLSAPRASMELSWRSGPSPKTARPRMPSPRYTTLGERYLVELMMRC